MTPQDKNSEEELERMAESYVDQCLSMPEYRQRSTEADLNYAPYCMEIFDGSDMTAAFITGYRAAQSSKPEWPSEDEIKERAREYEATNRRGPEYFAFQAGVEWLKKVMGGV